jgi:hypothetical protein
MGQCDPAGIVFYPQYLVLLDSSTGLLFERTGLSASTCAANTASSACRWSNWARGFLSLPFRRQIAIDSSGSNGAARAVVRHLILKGGEIAVDGLRSVRAMPDPDQPAKIKAQRVPPEIIAAPPTAVKPT